MKNSTLNKTAEEIKIDYLEWKNYMLETSAICGRMYVLTKNKQFLELLFSLRKEAEVWEKKSKELNSL